MVQHSSGCCTYSMFLDAWGVISSPFGIFGRSQLIDWIRFRGLDVSFDVCIEVSVPKLALVFFAFLSRVQSFLMLFFNLLLLSLNLWSSKPCLMFFWMWESTIPYTRSRWQEARNRLSWFEEWYVSSNVQLSAMTLKGSSEMTEKAYVLMIDDCSFCSIRVMGVCT